MKRFSIRDILFVIAVAALALGWWTDHRNLTTICNRQATELGVFTTPQVDSY
jgi:hypothetical protein